MLNASLNRLESSALFRSASNVLVGLTDLGDRGYCWKLPSWMSTRSWGNSGASKGLGAIYKRVGRSAAAGWIGEWLAACKA